MDTASIYKDLSYGEKPVITLLMDTIATRELRIVFRKGQEMKAHKAPHPIVIHIVEGSIDFGCEDKRQLLEKGTMVALDALVIHDLKAMEDSMVRLSINKLDSADRVQQAVL